VSELENICAQLEPDAQRVVLEVARRMLQGQKHYGVLDLQRDSRDFKKEISEEIWDGLAYSAMAFLKRVPPV
jgi:hypothetical protein